VHDDQCGADDAERLGADQPRKDQKQDETQGRLKADTRQHPD
jgi:hypothetical protein